MPLRRLFELTGLRVQENQARRLLNDLDHFRAEERRRRREGRYAVSVRESEERARAIGIDVTRHRRVALVFSGALAGLAGGLFAIYQNFVSPELLFFALSGEVVVIALLGGMGTLYGSLVGAVIAIGLREVLSTYTDNWLVVLGALYVACVMCFPQGLTRLLARTA